ncbi:Calpain-9 [Sciurus carolinensis]|uniref:Calpain-9 n=1 Tax=Sciurus carolinensis TaxID=30640 RepID=A0AA41SZP2_SCICA|nr:Calpain-9 [Sciurus carolinensis]
MSGADALLARCPPSLSASLACGAEDGGPPAHGHHQVLLTCCLEALSVALAWRWKEARWSWVGALPSSPRLQRKQVLRATLLRRSPGGTREDGCVWVSGLAGGKRLGVPPGPQTSPSGRLPGLAPRAGHKCGSDISREVQTRVLQRDRPERACQGAAMPYLHGAAGPQAHPVPKDAWTTHSSGQSFEQLRQGCLQAGRLFEDMDFPADNTSLFYSERPPVPFVWKRPGEIVEKPEFILGGATRTDICQGELAEPVTTSVLISAPWHGTESAILGALAGVAEQEAPLASSSTTSYSLSKSWWRLKNRLVHKKPIRPHPSRGPLRQAITGDCWLLAAIASLTLNEKALARVVPQDQSFGPGYAGIFHFQFWQHSEWLDVVIDDRLPTFRGRLVFLHSADHNEFWSALLEKAYAKLNGSYEALKGGSTVEAMEDFTGGVAETFLTREAPQDFYAILGKALKRGSLLGCSIDIRNAAESEARTPFGLIKGHAYTVTGLDQVDVRGQKIELIRVRNPWGQVEWNGPWSDSSPEWQSVGLADQKRLCHAALDDGEFWMAFEDFRAHFDKVELCNLTPDALQEDALHRWEVAVHQGSWVRGSTAGGCRNFLDTFWTNPQIKLSLTEKDEGQEGCTFLVALMQKDRRKLKRFGADMLTIGYAIYQSPGRDGHLDKDFFRYHASLARSRTFINLREVSDRFRLPPGEYVLVPSTFEPHQEADFCLRIFSEKKAISRDLDGTVDIDLPEPPQPTPPEQETEEEQQFRALFRRVAGEDMEVTAEELEYVLNAVLQKRKDLKFKKLSLISCRNIISLMDTSGNGKLEFSEFRVFWDKLKQWINLFTEFDVDRSGTMSSYELRTALRASGEDRWGVGCRGFQLSSRLLQLIVLRYADEGLQLDLDDFLNCLVRLENASRVFQALRMKNQDFIHLNINEFINLTMNI